MGYLEELQNLSDYQSQQQMMPEPKVKGEVPYGIPKESIFARIRSKLGDDRIAGLIGALTLPEGRIDESGQRIGYSPFQAGLVGYQQGKQGYADRQAALMKAQMDANMARREIEAKETTAGAAQTRANAYAARVRSQNAQTPKEDPWQRRLSFYMNLTPQGRKDAQAAGAIPRDPRTAALDNEDMMVQALVDEFQFSEPEARLIARTKPTLLSTGTDYDLKGFEDPKSPNYGKLSLRNTRSYGVPKRVRAIIEAAGHSVDDVYGFTSANAPHTAPATRDEVMQMDETEIEALLNTLPPEATSPEFYEWARDRLNEIDAGE